MTDRRVLVCGGRDYCDLPTVNAFLDGITPRPTMIIHGGARGADECAWRWACRSCVPDEAYPADWKTHGRAAGPIRNQRMLDEGKPDLVVAFPGGRGTADMVRRAKAAGVKVIEVKP